MEEKKEIRVDKNVSETWSTVEADVHSRSGHENKSYRNSQKLGRRPERTEIRILS